MRRLPVTLAVLSLFTALSAGHAAAQPADAAPPVQRIELEIGEDTTFFTGPVNEDGTIDYVAALNQHYGEGIANEDNAFVLMAQLHPAFTAATADHHRIYRDRLFELLEIERKPVMPRFVLWKEFARQEGLGEEQADAMHGGAYGRLWEASEFPELSAWVEANRPVIVTLDQALSRERYFSPLCRTEEGEAVLDVLLPHLLLQRNVGRLLCSVRFVRWRMVMTKMFWHT